MKNHNLIWIVGIVVFTVVVGAVFEEGKPQMEVSLFDEGSSGVSSGTVQDGLNLYTRDKGVLYKVTIALNQGVSEPTPYRFDETYGTSRLGNYLVDVLGLGTPSSTDFFSDFIPLIAFDSTQASPYKGVYKVFNREYYVLLKPGIGPLVEDKTYRNVELSATISKADPDVLPYILNSSYCQMDSDCSIGYDFCTYSSYNKFRKFMDVWGCEGTLYPDEDEKELLTFCDTRTQYPEVRYRGSRCINKSCVPQDREVICRNGEPR